MALTDFIADTAFMALTAFSAVTCFAETARRAVTALSEPTGPEALTDFVVVVGFVADFVRDFF
jgi:hypothetical protein